MRIVYQGKAANCAIGYYNSRMIQDGMLTALRPARSRAALAAFFAVNFGLHLVTQWPWMRESAWFWRAAQTLLVTFWFRQEGVDLLHYQLPIFGPPWQVPFEFPLYQAASALMARFFSLDLLTASHLTSLLIFYLAALLLYGVCRQFLPGRAAPLAIFVVFLWQPYNFNYAKEILMDYTALMFDLGALYLAARWFRRPGRAGRALLAAICLALGGMVKVTTLPVVLLPMLFLLLRSLSEMGFQSAWLARPRQLAAFIGSHRAYFALLGLLALLPVAASALWTQHADTIKAASPLTAWLTSSGLREWNFGNWAEKTSLPGWRAYFVQLQRYFFPGGTLLLPVIGWLGLLRAPAKTRVFIISALLGTFLTIFIFFGLYFHEYYYIAVSANISILIGYGIERALGWLQGRRKAWLWLAAAVLFAALVAGPMLHAFGDFRAYIDREHRTSEARYTALGAAARAVTPADAAVILIQRDWEPDLALAVERKAFQVNFHNSYLFHCGRLDGANYTTVVDTLGSKDLERVLACFEGYEQSYPGVYRVWR